MAEERIEDTLQSLAKKNRQIVGVLVAKDVWKELAEELGDFNLSLMIFYPSRDRAVRAWPDAGLPKGKVDILWVPDVWREEDERKPKRRRRQVVRKKPKG